MLIPNRHKNQIFHTQWLQTYPDFQFCFLLLSKWSPLSPELGWLCSLYCHTTCHSGTHSWVQHKYRWFALVQYNAPKFSMQWYFFASRNMSWIGVTKIAVAMSKVVVRVVEGRCGYFLLHCLATGSLHHQETHTLGKPQSHCRPYHQQSSTSLPSTNIKLFPIDGIWIFWAKATQFKLSYRSNL